jgi:uncharacterized integral membrane protein (TIGR00698 family)
VAAGTIVGDVPELIAPSEPVATRAPLPRRAARRALAVTPGLAVACTIAVVATVIGHLAPLLGAPVAGIVIGVLLSGVLRRHSVLRPGIGYGKGFVLQLAVVVLGSQLSLREVVHVGFDSLPVMLGTLTVCLSLAYLLGRRMGIDGGLRTLIGVGTGICGASAIAAVSPVIKARSNDVAYAISTIFAFNVAAVLLFPPLGHALGLSQHAFGLFAGTAVNDTSSVVAAATTYGTAAGNYAVVVKLTRTLMIIPICLGLAALAQRRAARTGGESPARAGEHALARAVRLVPWFLIGFLVVAAANSVGLIPAASHAALEHVSLFLITAALSAIGLSTDAAALRRAGHRPLLLGGILWVAVAATSLLLQWAGA